MQAIAHSQCCPLNSIIDNWILKYTLWITSGLSTSRFRAFVWLLYFLCGWFRYEGLECQYSYCECCNDNGRPVRFNAESIYDRVCTDITAVCRYKMYSDSLEQQWRHSVQPVNGKVSGCYVKIYCDSCSCFSFMTNHGQFLSLCQE